MDIEKEILGNEPTVPSIKEILNNAYLMSDQFPISKKESLVDLLGGEEAEIKVWGKELKAEELASKILDNLKTIHTPDNLIDSIVDEPYVNVFGRWLIWSEILGYKYPVVDKKSFIGQSKNLDKYGIEVENTAESLEYPISNAEHLLLQLIVKNPDLATKKRYNTAKEYLSEITVEPAPVQAIPEMETMTKATEEEEPGEEDMGEFRLYIELPTIRDMNFDVYMPPEENRFILTACRAVARMPSGAYNPFLIHGPEGTGKTHLLYSIINEMKEKHGNISICWLVGNEIEHMDVSNLSRYKVVVIDDLAKDDSYSETIPILTGLVEGGTQVIISMESNPEEIPEMKEGVLDRFEGAFIDEAHVPTGEEMKGILKLWQKHINNQLTDMGVENDILAEDEVIDHLLDVTDNDIAQAVLAFTAAANATLNMKEEKISKNIIETTASQIKEGGLREEFYNVEDFRPPKTREPKREGGTEDEKDAPQVEFVPIEQEDEDEGKEKGPIDFIPGMSYMVEEEQMEAVYKALDLILKNDYPGVGICRGNPRMLNHKYKVPTDNLVWLTDKSSSEYKCMGPVLENIIYFIDEFIDNNAEESQGMILIDGLEYLVSNNTFNKVLKFIRHLVDDISETSFILLIPVSPLTINEQELKIMEREMDVLSSIRAVMLTEDGKLQALE